MLTAVISIFVAMITMTLYPDSNGPEMKFNKLARSVLFGFVLVPWIMIVCLTDLYIQNAAIRQDVTNSLSCN